VRFIVFLVCGRRAFCCCAHRAGRSSEAASRDENACVDYLFSLLPYYLYYTTCILTLPSRHHAITSSSQIIGRIARYCNQCNGKIVYPRSNRARIVALFSLPWKPWLPNRTKMSSSQRTGLLNLHHYTTHKSDVWSYSGRSDFSYVRSLLVRQLPIVACVPDDMYSIWVLLCLVK
jgi:hypothetical protein